MTQSHRTAGHLPARRRVWPHRLVTLILILSGGALMSLPVAETYANNQQGSQDVRAYVQSAAAADPGPLRTTLARARAYNTVLSPTALWDPWGDETIIRSPAHDEYLALLDEFRAMGRIRIPQISVDLPILHDTTKESLSRGVGHMYGTSLPVGGTGTHAVLAGHTGMKNRTLFDRLPEMQIGHSFFIDVHGTTLSYRVETIAVVEPWELEAVERVAGADLVTLVTCYTPPGEHIQRLLVRGSRVPDPAPAASAPPAPGTDAAPVAAAPPATAALPVAADISVQTWMVPRLAATAGAAFLAGLMGLSWAIGARREARGVPHAAPDTREAREALR